MCDCVIEQIVMIQQKKSISYPFVSMTVPIATNTRGTLQDKLIIQQYFTIIFIFIAMSVRPVLCQILTRW